MNELNLEKINKIKAISENIDEYWLNFYLRLYNKNVFLETQFRKEIQKSIQNKIDRIIIEGSKLIALNSAETPNQKLDFQKSRSLPNSAKTPSQMRKEPISFIYKNNFLKET